jgi:hypothetical protein
MSNSISRKTNTGSPASESLGGGWHLLATSISSHTPESPTGQLIPHTQMRCPRDGTWLPAKCLGVGGWRTAKDFLGAGSAEKLDKNIQRVESLEEGTLV